MSERRYDAVLLDLDGTLVTDDGSILPRTLEALRAARANGVRVMLSTGRSDLGVRPVLDALELDTPAVIFNGAGLFCPVRRRMIEERRLSETVVERALAHAHGGSLLPVVVRAGAKFAPHPRTTYEEAALRYFDGLALCEHGALPMSQVIRVTLFSAGHPTSGDLAREIETAVERPVYVTHFPLNTLADHRGSPLSVADVQPPCRGKAEGLRVLRETYGIPPERVVAVGDATNDLPMFAEAGLSVAMQNAMEEALRAADRVIGSNNTEAVAELIEELFLGFR
jgi:hydroxymethylpyrimidine pyrophosphatase-like HAD family hydrolase